MALRNRIINFKPVATATLDTVATLRSPEQRTVLRVATVAVADEEKRGNTPAHTDWLPEKTIPENAAELSDAPNTPAICMNCERLELVELMGKPVPGCLYVTLGEYPEGWRRIPDSIDKCLFGCRLNIN